MIWTTLALYLLGAALMAIFAYSQNASTSVRFWLTVVLWPVAVISFYGAAVLAL